ncbi:MAG: hypothetical protein HQ504_09865 [Rhodospirillaceae bacterium]|nr:hypothetical protein [Rhodospirillaceae bacterium]
MIGAGAAVAKDSNRSIGISLKQIGTFNHGTAYDDGQAEIVAYDAKSEQVFVINAADGTVDILDVSDPAKPDKVGQIKVTDDLIGKPVGGINSVAVHKGLVAVAVENDVQQDNGWAAFYDKDGNFLNYVEAGALPDAVTFTPNGKYVLVANEGQPSDDYTNDPEGSVTIINLRRGVYNPKVRTAGFNRFNGKAPKGVRISGPNASVAQDLEPEYIAISKDSRTAELWPNLVFEHLS